MASVFSFFPTSQIALAIVHEVAVPCDHLWLVTSVSSVEYVHQDIDEETSEASHQHHERLLDEGLIDEAFHSRIDDED